MEGASGSPASRLLPLVLPGLVGGIFSSLLLIVVDAVANALEGILWSAIPPALAASSPLPAVA
jgi:hypothetical protein